jgi:hypothetical protein
VYTYPWTRFLAPLGELLRVERNAYLPDPETRYGKALNPHAQPFEAWAAQQPCIVILGESGAGKSHTISRYVEQRQSANHRTLGFQLGEYGSEERLIRDVFESDRMLEWVRDGGSLELVLDSFDECQLRIHHLPRLLIRKLEDLPRDRLSLRIACRTAGWSETLARQVRMWWPHAMELELLPLRERDVHAAAAVRELDPDAFVAAVRDRNADGLAARAMTLGWLLDGFARAGELPPDRHRLWEGALLHLCDEPRQRKDNVPPREVTARQMLSVASRIAACLLLSGKAAIAEELSEGDDALDASSLVGGPEGKGEYEVEITVPILRLALRSTGLFDGRGSGKLGFIHQGIAEFLAARFLATNSFSVKQLLSLLRVPEIDDLRIAPPLFGLTAWLASMHHGVFDSVAVIQPEILVAADLQDADQRRLVLKRLLERVDARRTARPEAASHMSYRQLKYEGMADDLRPWLERNRSAEVRELACSVVRGCMLTSLSDELATIALDETDPLRLDAALVVANIGPPECKARLRPLALGAAGPDPDDDLKGVGLMATWPDHLTPTELFESLTPAKRRNFTGLYEIFRYSDKVVAPLSAEGIVAGVRWAGTEVSQREGVSLHDLTGRVVQRAMLGMESPGVLAAVIGFALACRAADAPLFQRTLDADEPHPLDDAAIRHSLVVNLMARLARDPQFPSWVFWRAKLIRSEDFPWVIEQGLIRAADEHEAWGRLGRFAWNPHDATHVEALAALDQVDATAAEWLPVPRGPIAEEREAAAPLIERDACPAALRTTIQRTLERAEGDYSFWEPLAGLFLPPGRIQLDITETACWNGITEHDRTTALQVARRYLETVIPTALESEAMHQDGRLGGKLVSGYLALGLLCVASPHALEGLAPALWDRWCPIVVLMFGQESDQEKATQRSLLTRAYAVAPDTVIAVVRRALRGRHGLGILETIASIWDQRLAAALVEDARRDDLKPGTLEYLLCFLLKHQTEGAVEAALALITLPREAGSPTRDRSTAAGRALQLIPASWDHLWGVIQADPQWGRDVLVDPQGWPLDDTFAGLTEGLGVADLGRLASWFIMEYPYESNTDPFAPGAWQRGSVLDALSRRRTPASAAVLRELSAEFPQYPWLTRMALDAIEAADARLWTPLDHRKLLLMARNTEARLVTSNEQLQALIEESLIRLQTSLQDPPHAVRFLWNPDWDDRTRAIPRTEEDLSDWIADHLRRDMKDRKLVVNREVEVSRRHLGGGIGDRADIRVDALASMGGTPFSVLLEVKGCWNRQLRTAIEQQLVNRYLPGEHVRHGTYIVGWFLCDTWPNERKDTGRRIFNEMEQCKGEMSAEAVRLTAAARAVVKSFVLDCRWIP